ncbi:hypothetical protein V6Z11_A10G075900 [Gossypium hirsutum]
MAYQSLSKNLPVSQVISTAAPVKQSSSGTLRIYGLQLIAPCPAYNHSHVYNVTANNSQMTVPIDNVTANNSQMTVPIDNHSLNNFCRNKMEGSLIPSHIPRQFTSYTSSLAFFLKYLCLVYGFENITYQKLLGKI